MNINAKKLEKEKKRKVNCWVKMIKRKKEKKECTRTYLPCPGVSGYERKKLSLILWWNRYEDLGAVERDIGTAQSKSRAHNILNTDFLLNRTNIPLNWSISPVTTFDLSLASNKSANKTKPKKREKAIHNTNKKNKKLKLKEVAYIHKKT